MQQAFQEFKALNHHSPKALIFSEHYLLSGSFCHWTRGEDSEVAKTNPDEAQRNKGAVVPSLISELVFLEHWALPTPLSSYTHIQWAFPPCGVTGVSEREGARGQEAGRRRGRAIFYCSFFLQWLAALITSKPMVRTRLSGRWSRSQVGYKKVWSGDWKGKGLETEMWIPGREYMDWWLGVGYKVRWKHM